MIAPRHGIALGTFYFHLKMNLKISPDKIKAFFKQTEKKNYSIAHG